MERWFGEHIREALAILRATGKKERRVSFIAGNSRSLLRALKEEIRSADFLQIDDALRDAIEVELKQPDVVRWRPEISTGGISSPPGDYEVWN